MVRHILDYYLFECQHLPDLSVSTVKELRPPEKRDIRRKVRRERYAIAYQATGTPFRKSDFWPPDPFANAWLMDLGLRNRRHSLIETVLKEFFDWFPA